MAKKSKNPPVTGANTVKEPTDTATDAVVTDSINSTPDVVNDGREDDASEVTKDPVVEDVVVEEVLSSVTTPVTANDLIADPLPADVGDFRLLDKTVVEFLNNLPEHSKFLRGLVSWSGYETDYVYFDREKRFAGQTHYSFSKMLNFALDGITSFSTKPLRLATYFGFFSATIGFVGILYALI